MKKKETINGGAWGKKFDAELNTDVCDRYNNAEITVISKLFIQQGNPSGNARTGTTNDSDGTSHDILRWNASEWNAWKSRFVQVARRSGHGKFWLINNFKWNEFKDKAIDYYPNIWCRLKINLVNSAANAHHSITVFRITKSGKRTFRPDFSLMTNYSTWEQRTVQDSNKKWAKQRASVHEFFHILGVKHVDHGKAHCPSASGGNAEACYGVADADIHSLMGAGMELQAKFADPWRRAAIKLTTKGTVGSADDWKPVKTRHYPRTLSEVTNGAAITSRPNRR